MIENKFNKEELMKFICKEYGYRLAIRNNGEVTCDHREYDPGLYFRYANIDDALIDFLETLIDSDKERKGEGLPAEFSKEIEFIENLKNTKDEDFVAYEPNNQLQIKYDVKLQVIESDGETFKIESSGPLLMIAEGKVQDVGRLIVVKKDDKYLLQCVTNKHTIAKENIECFIGMGLQELYEMCRKLCEDYADTPVSYMKIKDKYHEVNSLVDFIKLNILEDVFINQIEYKFNCADSRLLTGIMQFHNDDYTLYETQEKVYGCLTFCNNDIKLFKSICDDVVDYDFNKINSNELLIGLWIEDVAKEYIKKMVSLDDARLFEYIAHEQYFINEVEHQEIEGCIVVKL